MKPFDLEKAKAGAPVCTRDGRNVRIICFDRETDNDYSIVALAKSPMKEDLYFHDREGRFSPGKDSPNDLFMKTIEHTAYVVVYAELGNKGTSYQFVSPMIFREKQKAEEYKRELGSRNGSYYPSWVAEIKWEE